ncbi:hypothetical protein L207DRAFT_588955 [Hyaloscypha variabilis F]|uniref:BHLH domain-containing protein n=1 Tax=Hyaloscypha variabilis (strain UAMH 11265 / GT02V1 / F) TaxID=1149755 RepID=A0A2J6R763_HYAVF|nr:hypothetical protein L207DRAFT_588955 [Hyaloscypha variabilis F]
MEARAPVPDVSIEKMFLCVDANTVQAHGGAEWQFSAGPSMPEWPQTTPDFTSNNFRAGETDSDFVGTTWGFSDDLLFNADTWEEWDLGFADITTNDDSQAPLSPEETSISPNQFPQPQPAKLWDEQLYISATTSSASESRDGSGLSNMVAGKQRVYAQPRRNGRPPGRRSTTLTGASGQSTGTVPGVLFLGKIDQTRENKKHSNFEPELPAISRSTASPKPAGQAATARKATSQQPEKLRSLHYQAKEKRYHKNTEQQYRLRLNERFSALLKALPDDLVRSASGSSSRSQADMALSKIEILALAKSHIASLEQKQSELKQESLVLRGQQDLFKRLCGREIGNS